MDNNTHLATAIDAITPLKVRYDKNIKELLADVQILAYILKYTVSEVADLSLEEIMECIDQDSIQIGTVPISPGLTNTRRIENTQTEDADPGESYITFDLRFSLTVHPFYIIGNAIKIIINLEAQKSSDAGKIGYHLENRITYYMARLISSQKETEFFHSDYDNIKKIYSIWICMDCKTESISQISLTQKELFGKADAQMTFDKMHAIIIQLKKSNEKSNSKNRLIAMLEDLLCNEDRNNKKNRLKEKYGMKMTIELEGRLANMCNLSDLVVERSMECGMERGISAIILDNLRENTSKERIIEKLQEYFSLSPDKANAYFEKYASQDTKS